MSRLDDAITAIERAFGDLSEAFEARNAAQAKAQADAQAKAQAEAGAEAGAPDKFGQDELRAMKSELQEAMSLLQEVQKVPNAGANGASEGEGA